MRSADRIAREIATHQHGVVARRQLREHGATRGAIRNLTGPHGRWVPLGDEVLRLTGTADSPDQRTAAGVLDAGPGAVLSYSAAGNWWGLSGCALEPTLVARTSSSRRGSTLATIHRVRFLPGGWTTTHRGVAVVRPEMLALQLFSTSRFERAERLVERLWSLRTFSGASLARFLRAVPLRGVRGSAALRRYFDARGVDYRPPDSGLESRFQQITCDAGLEFRRQVDTGDDEHWTGRVDFLHIDRPFVVEIQSEAYHSSLIDQRADEARMAALRIAGFTVLEVTDTMVWTQPRAVVEKVCEGLELCRRTRRS